MSLDVELHTISCGGFAPPASVLNVTTANLLHVTRNRKSVQVIDVYKGMGGVPAPGWKTALPPKCVLNSSWPPCKWYCDTQSCSPGQCHPNDVGCAHLAAVVYNGWLHAAELGGRPATSRTTALPPPGWPYIGGALPYIGAEDPVIYEPPCTAENKQKAIYLSYNLSGPGLVDEPATELAVSTTWVNVSGIRRYGSNGWFGSIFGMRHVSRNHSVWRKPPSWQ